MGKAEGAWWGLQEGCGSTWEHQGEPSEWSVCHPKCSCRDKGCVGLLEENVSIQAGAPGSGFVGEPTWSGLRFCCPSSCFLGQQC